MVEYRKKVSIKIVFDKLKEDADITLIEKKAKETFPKSKIKTSVTKYRYPPVIHYKNHPCGTYTDNSKSTDEIEKVTCCNCISNINRLKDGFAVECPQCRTIYNRWEWNNEINFCRKCGYQKP